MRWLTIPSTKPSQDTRTHVQVVIHQDGSVSVEDNGRGIPVDPMKDNDNKTALETVLTVLHAGGKFDKNTYQVSGRC